MKLTEIILDDFAPQNLRALWLQPKADNTVAFKVFNNGMWMNTFEWEDHSEYLTQHEADKLYNPLLNYSNGVEAVKVDGNTLKLLDDNGNTVIAVDSAGNSYIILGWPDQENILIEPSQVTIRNNGVNAFNINANNRSIFYNNGNRAIRIQPTALNLCAPSTENIITLSDAYTSIFGPDGVRQGLVISKNNHTVTLGNSEDSTKIEDKVFTQEYTEDGIILTNRNTSQVFTIPYNINTLLVNGLAGKADNFTVGTGLEMTPERVLNVTLDVTVFKVVNALPESPAAGDENKIFLVPNPSSTEEGNYYIEYIWVISEQNPNGKWEEIGTYKSDVDLSIYQTKTDNNLQTTNKTIVGAINEVNTKSGYYIDGSTINSNSTSEEISEAIGGYDNLLNAINNKTPIYVYSTQYEIDFFLPVIYITVERNTITIAYFLGPNISFISITNNNEVLSCFAYTAGLQTVNDSTLNTSSKTIVGAINEVNDKTPVYTTVPELTADYTIPFNRSTREYIYEISIGATTYNVTADEEIKWIDNNLPLVEANSKLIVSVVNNIAVWGTVYE